MYGFRNTIFRMLYSEYVIFKGLDFAWRMDEASGNCGNAILEVCNNA